VVRVLKDMVLMF